MICLNLGHYHIVEKLGDKRRRVVYREHNEQVDRVATQKRFLMGIRILGVALVLSVSMLWAQGFDERMQMTERDRRLMEDERQSQQLKMELPSLQFEKPSRKLSKREKAQEKFEKALEAARKKKYKKALQQLKKATKIYPQYTEAFYEMGQIYLEMGRIYLQQGRKEEARKAFGQAIVANPKWVHSYDEPQPLLETSNEILQLYPTLSVGHLLHSYVNLSLGRVEEAEKSALQANQHEHRKVPQIHLLLAKIYLQKGKLEEAEKQLRTFLAKRGSYARALYGKAIEAYEKAIALKPDAADYHYNLGRVLASAAEGAKHGR